MEFFVRKKPCSEILVREKNFRPPKLSARYPPLLLWQDWIHLGDLNMEPPKYIHDYASYIYSIVLSNNNNCIKLQTLEWLKCSSNYKWVRSRVIMLQFDRMFAWTYMVWNCQLQHRCYELSGRFLSTSKGCTSVNFTLIKIYTVSFIQKWPWLHQSIQILVSIYFLCTST